MAYNAVSYYMDLASQAAASGSADTASYLLGMAKEAKAKECAEKAAQRAQRRRQRRAPLMGFASSGTGFVIKPY